MAGGLIPDPFPPEWASEWGEAVACGLRLRSKRPDTGSLVKPISCTLLSALKPRVQVKAQKEPAGINKNGKPVAVMVSAAEYQELNSLKEQWLKMELRKGMDDLQAGRVKDGQSVIDRQRNRLSDASL